MTHTQLQTIMQLIDEAYDETMARADSAAENGAFRVASARAMKAHGLLQALRIVERVTGQQASRTIERA